MKYSRRELIQAQTQPQNLLLGLRISLALGKDGSLRKKKGFLAGLDLLEGPLWSPMPLEAVLVTVAHAVAPGRDEV